ncbi:MAG: insulinase family protein, partial [Ferruginibacter sp.]|nr:insulinase family protein [Ferruginibacter sp.]
NEDTKKYTAEQMAVELQKIGSNINVSSSFDGTVFNVQTLKKNLGKTLELLEERMLNPNFTQANFSRIQKQAIEGFSN